MIRRAIFITGALLAACVPAACASAATPSIPATASPTANPTSTSSPSATLAAHLDVELDEVPAAHQPCSTSLWNLGTEIVWAEYAPQYESCPDIWRYVPGARQPELVFRSEDREANLGPVVGQNDAYAFIDRRHDGIIDTGWRLWYIDHAGAEAVQLAEGASGAQAWATLTADAERIVWAGFDPPDGETSSLRVARWSDPGAIETLATSSIHQSVIWATALHGDKLWYGIIRGDWATQVQEEARIEVLDLSDAAATSTAMPGIAGAFNPAANDGFVAYKRPGLGFSALSWGTIVVVDRTSGKAASIAQNGDLPSIGDRFLTFETIAGRQVSVYDPAAEQLYVVRTVEANGGVRAVSIRANLLSFVQYPEDGPSTIWWGSLPN